MFTAVIPLEVEREQSYGGVSECLGNMSLSEKEAKLAVMHYYYYCYYYYHYYHYY